MHQRRSLLLATAAGLVLPRRHASAQSAYKPEYKVSIAAPPDSTCGIGAELFCKLVRDGTRGRINLKLFPGGKLADRPNEFDALRKGLIDVVFGSPSTWTRRPELAVFALPFLTKNLKAWGDVTTDKAVVELFFKLVRKAGAEPLSLGWAGPRQLSNSKRAVESPQHLSGLVIWPASEIERATLSALGAKLPAQMTWGEVRAGLTTGVLTGVNQPTEVFVSERLHTVGQKFVTQWNISNDVLLLAVAPAVWASWSGPDQTIVREAAHEAARRQIALSKDRNTSLSDLGVAVGTLTDAQLAPFRTSTKALCDEWRLTKTDEVLYDAVVKAANG